ncbi:TPA: nucleoid-associated protein, partial [Streptococcus suis]|nr:nucleoid-associated protein [Streptococcus suis]
LVLADQLLTVSPKIEEYLRKKIERVFSDEAKTGQFEADNPFLNFLSEDLLTSSVKIAGLWKEEFSISENLKTNDLIFIEFERNGVEHFAFLRIA